MAKILVHLTHGPEHPTRAALAFLVARSAIDEGHSVSMFLAGDAVQGVSQTRTCGTNRLSSPCQTCWFNSRLSTTACSLIKLVFRQFYFVMNDGFVKSPFLAIF